MSQATDPTTPQGVGPRTGSDPSNSAQEIAVLRAEVHGLERLMVQKFESLEAALTLQASEYARRLEQLNGERELERRRAEGFISREVFDSTQRDIRMQTQGSSDKIIGLTSDLSALREQIASMRSGQEWLIRLVAGAVITGVVAAAFALVRLVPT